MQSFDVVIVGAGFGGSLLSLVLHRAGMRVALIDRGMHPRFVIGESSTPIANLVLSDLCREYDLPNIAPLTKYGSWQKTHPNLVAGIKRGFSYFGHQANRKFAADSDHSTELLVAASSRDESADTHWLRQDVDSFLFREAAASGVVCREQTEVVELQLAGDTVELNLSDKSVFRTRFVVDATGEACWLVKRLEIADRTHEMRSHSRAVFAHFADVKRWQRCLNEWGVPTTDHPFDCDHAALHHVFEGGWMWQLRFNDESVSAGFVLVDEPAAAIRSETATELWQRCLARYPSIAAQFADARIVRPADGLRVSPRLQRKVAQATGPWWALLPNTAGFVDPLHSSGIAHTLCGIERLARVLIRSLGRAELLDELRQYESCVLAELDLIDQLVSGCFLGLCDFRLFGLMSMLYFAAATSYERSRLASATRFAPAFLLADDSEWRSTVDQLWTTAYDIAAMPRSEQARRIAKFEDELRAAIRDYNVVGLCDPVQRNMYRHSALPDES